MDSPFITPFVVSVQNVFSTLLQLQVNVGAPRRAGAPAGSGGIAAAITLGGDVEGVVTVRMPVATATAIGAVFVGSRMDAHDPNLADALGELANMICGNAKALFYGKRRVTISCPRVTVGTFASPASQALVIPCSTDCGELEIEISLHDSNPNRERRDALMEAAAANGR